MSCDDLVVAAPRSPPTRGCISVTHLVLARNDPQVGSNAGGDGSRRVLAACVGRQRFELDGMSPQSRCRPAGHMSCCPDRRSGCVHRSTPATAANTSSSSDNPTPGQKLPRQAGVEHEQDPAQRLRIIQPPTSARTFPVGFALRPTRLQRSAPPARPASPLRRATRPRRVRASARGNPDGDRPCGRPIRLMRVAVALQSICSAICDNALFRK
jgi:hypothetical protein